MADTIVETDALNEPSVPQVFSIDIRFIYWWIFILACCTFGLAVPPAKRYWRIIKDSSFDPKIKSRNKEILINLSSSEVIGLIAAITPLVQYKDKYAMGLDDALELDRCLMLMGLFLYTAAITWNCRLSSSIILHLMAEGAKRSSTMIWVWIALCLLTFVVLATFIMTPSTFVPKDKLTLGSYIWLVILISNCLNYVVSALRSSLIIYYAAAVTPEDVLHDMRVRIARKTAIMTVVMFAPFFLPLMPPVLGVEFQTGVTWLWLIASYQFFGHHTVALLLSAMANLVSRKIQSLNKASEAETEESPEPLLMWEYKSSDKEVQDSLV